MSDLFVNLLLAHLVGDFVLQSDSFCSRKRTMGAKGWRLHLHWVLLLLLSWLAVWRWDFWWGALLIGVSHLGIDVLKGGTENRCVKVADGKSIRLWKSRYSLWLFLADQAAHLAVIMGVAAWWQQVSDCWTQFAWLAELPSLYTRMVFALLLCWKPANVLIRLILQYYCVKPWTHGDYETFRSGALIGTLERYLIVLFVLLQHYEAIGFLIAAKSILRFGDTRESEKSEYVLAGTLLSFTIALVCGLFIRH